MLRKLRLRQKDGFLIKKTCIYIIRGSSFSILKTFLKCTRGIYFFDHSSYHCFITSGNSDKVRHLFLAKLLLLNYSFNKYLFWCFILLHYLLSKSLIASFSTNVLPRYAHSGVIIVIYTMSFDGYNFSYVLL